MQKPVGDITRQTDEGSSKTGRWKDRKTERQKDSRTGRQTDMPSGHLSAHFHISKGCQRSICNAEKDAQNGQKAAEENK